MLKNLEVQKFNFKKVYKNQKIIVILFIIGVILLIVPSFFKHKKNNIIKNIGNQEFVEKIQNDIADMVSNIEGAGKSKVLITLDEGEEIIYLAEKKENSQVITDENSYNQNLKRKTDDIEKKYITTKDSNGNETPVIIKKNRAQNQRRRDFLPRSPKSGSPRKYHQNGLSGTGYKFKQNLCNKI